MTLDRPWSLALGPVALAGSAFVAYAAATTTTLPAFVLLFSLVVSFIIGLFLSSTRWVWFGLAVVVTANLAIALTIDGIPWGLYGNPNVLGCAIAFALAGAIAYRWLWFIPIAIYGIWLSHSRAAAFGAGVAVVLGLWHWSRYWAFIAFLLVIVAVLAMPGHSIDSLTQRMGIWQDTLNHLTPLGRGWGSFFDAYWAFPIHTNLTLIRANHAYNDVLELIFELGIGAIPLWFVILISLEGAGHREWLIVAAFAALSLTYFPLYIPLVGQLFALTLGHALKGTLND